MNTKLQDALKKANSEVEAAGITDPGLNKIAFPQAVYFYLYGLEARSWVDTLKISKIAPGQPDNFWVELASLTGVELKGLKDIYSVKGDQILLVIS